MSKEKNFKEPIPKLDLRQAFPSDPNYAPIPNIEESKLKFKGNIARFRGMINRNLFNVIRKDLNNNLYNLYCLCIQEIT